jgi:HlyD family secretion protein
MIQSTSAMDRPVGRRKGLPVRALIGAALLAALLAAGVIAYPGVKRWWSAERSIDLARLRTGSVAMGDLQRDIAVQGKIIAAFHPTTSSPSSGIVSLRVRAGDVVKKGTILATVESPELRSRLEQEESTLLSMRSDLDRQRIATKQAILSDRQAVDLADVGLQAARRAMSRAERSRKEGIVNDIEFEKAQDDLARATLELDHARESADLRVGTMEFEIRNRELLAERQGLVVKELERQVRDLAVKAPVSGLVSRLDVQDHDAVTPGQALVAIVDLSAFEVEILVPEAYADEIAHGTPAVVTDSGHEYPATVRSISPEVEGSQVRGIVEFTGGTPAGIRQNQRVSTRLILESRVGVLKVPRGPFLESTGGRQAYVISGDTAELRTIETGATSVSEVEILSGLEAGETIILSDTTRFEGASRVYLHR